MERCNKASRFINNLNKPLLLRVLRLNYHESVDENSSVEELRALLQEKLSGFISEPQLESQADVTASSDVTPVESSTAKKAVKKTMGDDIKYKLNVDDWDTFVERLELYFDVNDTPSDKWVPEILTKVDEEAFKLIKNLAFPRKAKELAFEELVDLVSKHLNPKPSQAAERFKFSKARQYPDESVNDFVARLKSLSLNCNFENLEDSLKDQFVSGVRSNETRGELFQKPDLTFQSAVEVAVSREQASGGPSTRGGGRGRGAYRGGGRGGAQSDRGGAHSNRGGTHSDQGGSHGDRGAHRGRGQHHNQGQNQPKKDETKAKAAAPKPAPTNVVINVVAQNRGDGNSNSNQKRGGGGGGPNRGKPKPKGPKTDASKNTIVNK